MAPTPSEVASPVPISQDEQQESALVQQGIKPKDLKAGQVTLLDGRKLGFQIFVSLLFFISYTSFFSEKRRW